MNKKLFALGSAALVAGFFTLTAFQAKTLEAQRAEINAAVEAKLAELRMMKEQQCMERVLAEATIRVDDMRLAKAGATTPRGSGTRTPTRARGPKTTPTPTVDPQKERGGAVKQGDAQDQKERGGAVKPGDAQDQKKRPGAVKQGGGGN